MILELGRINRLTGVNFQQDRTGVALSLVDLIGKGRRSDPAGDSPSRSRDTITPMGSASADSRDGIGQYTPSPGQPLSGVLYAASVH